MKLRVSRKSKKWHKKRGWSLSFMENGEAFWFRTYGPFRTKR